MCSHRQIITIRASTTLLQEPHLASPVSVFNVIQNKKNWLLNEIEESWVVGSSQLPLFHQSACAKSANLDEPLHLQSLCGMSFGRLGMWLGISPIFNAFIIYMLVNDTCFNIVDILVSLLLQIYWKDFFVPNMDK
jgi:hypothetical protein